MCHLESRFYKNKINFDDNILIININMFNIVIVILLSLFISSESHLRMRENHDYWFNKWNPLHKDDHKWDYCDYKCLYLENLINNKDFVVVSLSAFLHDDFSVCYVKIGDSLILWNSVIENKFFEKTCGQDSKDWANNGAFTISGIYGEGIGTKLDD